MRHLLNPLDFSVEETNELLTLASDIEHNLKKYAHVCDGKKLATLFYEPSTRTRLSFESAMLSLGGSVLGFSSANSSSAAKGESVADTIRMISCYADIAAMRHPKEGSALVASMHSQIPVIMLTARGEERDELQGFKLGVDEYISKPFSPKILVARVEAILRRSNVAVSETTEVGGIRIDKAAHQVEIDGKPIDLSYKEFELLTYFVENQGIALSREKILNNVWNYDYFGDARTIDTHVKKLRSKMGEKGNYIKTIWGMGYKFEVD